MSIVTVGIDLAKNVFALHGVSEAGKPELLRPSVSRAKLNEVVAALPPCLIGMEACSGAHHWARLFAAHGHTVKLMAPKFIVPYRLSGKRGFESDFLAQYQDRLLPSQRNALGAMKGCRSSLSAQMLAQCSSCGQQRLVPHSCGHRSCPHCQHFESQRWIQRQTQALLPGNYFLITFTLPQELRGLAWTHQQVVHAALMQCAWEALAQFSRNHRQLRGQAGAVGVLHTHSRRLEFHPHVQMSMPASAFDAEHGLWRSLRKTSKGGHYLFNHKALAKVFRGKLLAALKTEGLTPPICLPERWVVDCKSVGNGHKALVYLGRYLYRGVIQERDIVRCADGQVTFGYRDSATGRKAFRTLSGTAFLWLVLQHVLPRGFRRSRNFGLLHPNCRHRARLDLLRLGMRQQPAAPTSASGQPAQSPALSDVLSERPKLQCRCCGALMVIVRRRILPAAFVNGGRARAEPVADGPVRAARAAGKEQVR